MSDSTPYIYGTEDQEISRLLMQHRLFSDQTVAHWARAGFRPGQTILDLGSGPGFTALDLAEWLGPQGNVIAVEPEAKYADVLQKELNGPSPRPRARITLKRTRAEDLSLEPESLDAVHARWVFTFVNDLDAVLKIVANALVPKGRLAVFDYFHWPTMSWGPRAETLPKVRNAVLAMNQAFETDANVGQRILPALVRTGFELTEIQPVVQLARPGDALWSWPSIWFTSCLPTVVAQGHLDSETFDAWKEEWRANTQDPAGYFLTPVQSAISAIKPA